MEECMSARIGARDIERASNVLFKAFVSEDKYGPIDKLGLAASPDAILAALFEVVRGVRAARVKDEEVESLESIVRAVVEDIKAGGRCVEDARRLVSLLAVRALARRASS